MTLNSKVLSLVLLSGLAMGGAYAKKSKLANTDWTEESQTVQWSNDKCDAATNNSCDKNDCKTCEERCSEKACNNLDLNCPNRVLNARADLLSANVIDDNGNIPNSITAPKGINSAAIELAWSSDLGTLHYRVSRCGTDAATTNGAALFQIQPGSKTTGVDQVLLFPLTLVGPNVTTTTVNDTVITTGCITQLELANNLSVPGNPVASNFHSNIGVVYNFAMAGEVTGAVYGTVADIGVNKPRAQGSVIPCNG